MKRLDRKQLEDRLRLDYQVAMRMPNPIMNVSAFRNAEELKAGRQSITDVTEGHQARHYRVEYCIKTLSGRGQYMAETVVHIDLLCNGNYPYSEPSCWVLSLPMPWSPHFKEGSPICLGEFWKEAQGNILLGHLLIHISRLLNFDEVARGGGYRGWNGEAVDYWKTVLQEKPITPELPYPVLPTEITHALASPARSSSPFRPATSDTPPAARPPVFRASSRA